MFVHVLGSSAGGGLPQWNCGCANCRAVRAGSADIEARTQSSVAVSADGQAWFLLNTSPDVRQQILGFPQLGPPEDAARGTGIAGCILTDPEIDHTAGLLLLREGCSMSILCTPIVRRWLSRYLGVEDVLASFADRTWGELSLVEAMSLRLPCGSESGLRVRAFEVDRHVPKFVKEDRDEAEGSVVGLEIEDTQTGGRLVYAPCVASIDEPLKQAVEQADCLLIDGTFWDDVEPQRCGITDRTARQMGHIPVSGTEGSLQWLAKLPIKNRVYIHINNTNPMLRRGSPEHLAVQEQGVRIAADGDVFEL